MSSPRFEAFLARLYSDDGFRERFMTLPGEAMLEAGLDDREKGAAADIDRVGLAMAARSYRVKRQHHGMQRRTLWRRLTWLLPLAASMAFVLCLRMDVARAASEKTYPVSLTRGSRLMISIRINGHPVDALLDSAAEATLVDKQAAASLQLTGGTSATGHGSGESSFDATLVNGVRIQALGLSLDNQTVAIADLSDVGKRLLGHRLDVILGREIFDSARLRIDIEERQISVVSSDEEPPGVKLALLAEHGVETVPVKVENRGPLRATFDLGNGSEVLVGSKLAARMHLLTDGREVTSKAGGGLGGAQERQVFTLRTLEVAGQRFTDVPAAIDAQSTASDVNIGISILRQFVITTDFAKRAVWLQPRATK